ncbi:hypothetical protein SUGI_1183000 [Cryptomeria japonica]|nr:hypothetical protein SUGI_1183000 [Cryptomeria japonica]
MTFLPNNEFDLSDFNSISFQPEKAYKNALDFYIQEFSQDGFGNPSSSSVGKKAGAQPSKQIIHKMIERKRRKDMNFLYSELRSLLPDERIRGNCSVSDQLDESVNYIRHLEQQIKDLKKERDKKNTRAGCFKGVEISKPLEFHDEGFPSIKIKSCGSAAFQVYINSIHNQIALSDVLLVLEECRVEVVSAALSVANEKVFHTIHAKVTDDSIANIDLLYVKLQHLISCRKIKTFNMREKRIA